MSSLTNIIQKKIIKSDQIILKIEKKSEVNNFNL